MKKYPPDFQIYLNPTPFIDFDSKEVADFVNETIKPERSRSENVISLYYAVRDRFLYNPYKMDFTVEGFKASTVIKRGYGFCITKAMLLIAAARLIGVPARLGCVDVRNHLTSEKLTKFFGDLFIYHSYADIFLNGKWVKATPAFNASLCDKFNVEPLEFDGTKDSLFQQFNKDGKRYMEYVNDRGVFHELPFDNIMSAFKECLRKGEADSNVEIEGDFAQDALETNDAVVYTDGACINNPGPGGYGVVIKYGDKRIELSEGYRLTTNNRMELLACIAGLRRFKERSSITLFSDSRYVVNGITKGWAERWRANGWMKNKKEPALNSDLWAKLLDLCEMHEIRFEWIKGHSDNTENEVCDRLATSAARGEKLLVDDLYENVGER